MILLPADDDRGSKARLNIPKYQSLDGFDPMRFQENARRNVAVDVAALPEQMRLVCIILDNGVAVDNQAKPGHSNGKNAAADEIPIAANDAPDVRIVH